MEQRGSQAHHPPGRLHCSRHLEAPLSPVPQAGGQRLATGQPMTGSGAVRASGFDGRGRTLDNEDSRTRSWAVAFSGSLMDLPVPAAPQTRPALVVDQQAVSTALDTDPVAVRIRAKDNPPQPGELVGVRLNLNVLRNTGIAVQTLHAPTNRAGYRRNKGFYNGDVRGYAAAVTLRHAYFNVNQPGREAIAAGEHNKFPMASIDGELLRVDSKANLDGVELRFNPKQTHLFVDANNRAVHHADEVTIVGHRAYARGTITYHTELSAPARTGDQPSVAIVAPAVPNEALLLDEASRTPTLATPRRAQVA